MSCCYIAGKTAVKLPRSWTSNPSLPGQEWLILTVLRTLSLASWSEFPLLLLL